MIERLRFLIYKFDFFSTLTVLRAKEEPQMANAGLGIFSFLLLSLFSWILIKNIVDIANMDTSQINYSSSLQLSGNDSKNVNNVMICIKADTLDGMNSTQFVRYFQFRGQITQFSNGPSQQFDLVPCKPEMWSLLGDNYQKIFADYKVGNYFCLPTLMSMTANNRDYALSIFMSACTGSSNCKSLAQINNLYNQVIIKNSYLPIRVGFLAPYAEVSDKNPLKYMLDFKDFSTSADQGKIADVTIDIFNIQTDKSVWPVVQFLSQLYGYSFHEVFTSQYQLQDFKLTTFSVFTLRIFITDYIIKYQQSISKIDSALSYVGGLMGVVTFFFLFFLKAFNEYRYELFVAENSFNYDTDGHKVREADFTFWKYLKFRIFFWYKLFFCRQFDWEDCKQMHETLDEAKNILQVSKLFRRIDVLEKIVWKSNDRNVLMVSTLRQFQSLDNAKKRRLTMQYYHQIIKMKEAATVEDAINQSSVSFKYLQVMQNSILKMKKSLTSLQSLPSNGVVPTRTELASSESSQNADLAKSLSKYLKMEDMPFICQAIARYPLIAIQAESMQKLDQEFEQIQQQMTKSLIRLPPHIKRQVIQKVPLKIIHRLRLKAIQMQSKGEGEVEMKQVNCSSQGRQEFTVRNQLDHQRDLNEGLVLSGKIYKSVIDQIYKGHEGQHKLSFGDFLFKVNGKQIS